MKKILTVLVSFCFIVVTLSSNVIVAQESLATIKEDKQNLKTRKESKSEQSFAGDGSKSHFNDAREETNTDSGTNGTSMQMLQESTGTKKHQDLNHTKSMNFKGLADASTWMPDEHLRRYFENVLNIDSGTLTKENLLDVTDFGIRDEYSIESLEGIQFAKNLNTINITGDFNALTDVSAIENLPNLTSITIKGAKALRVFNSGTDLPKLTQITIDSVTELVAMSVSNYPSLTNLKVNNTRLKTVEVGPELPKLANLNLSNNLIEDISEIKNLPLLNTLSLNKNALKTLNFGVGLPRLETLYANENSISTINGSDYVQNLYNVSLKNNLETTIKISGSFIRLTRIYLGTESKMVRQLPSVNGSLVMPFNEKIVINQQDFNLFDGIKTSHYFAKDLTNQSVVFNGSGSFELDVKSEKDVNTINSNASKTTIHYEGKFKVDVQGNQSDWKYIDTPTYSVENTFTTADGSVGKARFYLSGRDSYNQSYVTDFSNSFTWNGHEYYYVFRQGSSSTSKIYFKDYMENAATFQPLAIRDITNQIRDMGTNHDVRATQIFNKIKRIETRTLGNNGEIIHNIEIVNISSDVVKGRVRQQFDTMLNENDHVPIYANGIEGIYIQDIVKGQPVRLYIDAIEGIDDFSVGTYNVFDSVVPVRGKNYEKGEKIVSDTDSAVFYAIDLDLQPGERKTYAYKEFLSTAVSYTVRYLDSETLLPFQSSNQDVVDDVYLGVKTDPYKIEPKAILGYEYLRKTSNSKPLEGKLSEKNIVIELIYHRVKGENVTVKYIDSNDVPLSAETVLEGYLDETFNASAKELIGYHLKTSPILESGPFTKNPQDVIYVYEKLSVGDVRVRYVDEFEQELSPSLTLNGLRDTSYSSSVKDIIGYSLKTTPLNAKGVFTKTPQDVVYVYKALVSVKSDTFKIVYDGGQFDGGLSPVDHREYQLGDRIRVKDASMTRQGYTFKHWKINPEYKPGAEIVVDDNFIALTKGGTYTLVAVWEESKQPLPDTGYSVSHVPIIISLMGFGILMVNCLRKKQQK